MSTTEEVLKNDIELAKGIGQLAESLNQAITIIATAILELDATVTEFHGHGLNSGTYNAVQALAKTGEEWQ